MPQFASLNLPSPILRALDEEGYTTPTPIQGQAIGPVLAGRDLLGSAPTGTGKTAAFALPILGRLLGAPVDKTRRGPSRPRVLVLAPTRELAGQIDASFAAYGRHTGLRSTPVFGGVSQARQVRALRAGIDILIATPGRLIDLMEQRHVDLGEVGILVLDEADRMLDMGFIQPIRRIVSAIPASRQTVMFSATLSPEITRLAGSLLREPVRVAAAVPAPPRIDQSVYMVPRSTKQALLERLLDDPAVERAIVFTRTKHGADRACRRLARAGVEAGAIHGNKAQAQRLRTLAAFRDGRCRVLVATDVAARGLDIDAVSHVFNFDLPVEAEAYVHRIGRTARAGAAGIAISFCDAEERGLLRAIERLTGKPLATVRTPTDLPRQDAQDAVREVKGERPQRDTNGRPTRRTGARAEHPQGTHRVRPQGQHAPQGQHGAHQRGQNPARPQAQHATRESGEQPERQSGGHPARQTRPPHSEHRPGLHPKRSSRAGRASERAPQRSH